MVGDRCGAILVDYGLSITDLHSVFSACQHVACVQLLARRFPFGNTARWKLMLILGVSGKAGSGFDTDVADLLEQEGFFIVSADDCVDEAWRVPAVRLRVADIFGPEVFENADDPDPSKWERKRGALGAIVKDDPAAQERLNQLLQPFVMLAVFARLQSAPVGSFTGAAFIAPRLATFFHLMCHVTLFVDRDDASRIRAVEQFYHRRNFGNANYTQGKIEQTLTTQRDVKMPGEFQYDFVIIHPEDADRLKAAVKEVARSVTSTHLTQRQADPNLPLVLNIQSAGGQFLRAALSLAELSATSVTFKGYTAVANRRPLQLLDLCAICERVLGGDVRSVLSEDELTYAPGIQSLKGEHTIVAPEGASISPVLQLLLPVCLGSLETVTLHLQGQTELSRSAPADYFSSVFFPLLARTGARVTFAVKSRGFEKGPRGEVSICVQPTAQLVPADFTKRGDLREIVLHINATGLRGPEVADYAERIQRGLRSRAPITCCIREFEQPSPPALSMSLLLRTEHSLLGVDAATEGPCTESTAGEAISRLMEGANSLLNSTAAVDPFFADQILVYLAYAGGSLSIPTGFNDEHIFSQVRLLNSFEDDLVCVDATGNDITLHVRALTQRSKRHLRPL